MKEMFKKLFCRHYYNIGTIFPYYKIKNYNATVGVITYKCKKCSKIKSNLDIIEHYPLIAQGTCFKKEISLERACYIKSFGL